ncbi:hypothetical protein HW537_14585 [Asaia siamensis]
MMSVPAPANIEFLVQAVGDEAAFTFIEQLAGQVISVPRRVKGSRLALLYGDEIASALSEARGGDLWLVPVCRDWRIRRYLAMGMTIGEICQRAGVSKRAVYYSLSKPYRGQKAIRPRLSDDRQIDLF